MRLDDLAERDEAAHLILLTARALLRDATRVVAHARDEALVVGSYACVATLLGTTEVPPLDPSATLLIVVQPRVSVLARLLARDPTASGKIHRPAASDAVHVVVALATATMTLELPVAMLAVLALEAPTPTITSEVRGAARTH